MPGEPPFTLEVDQDLGRALQRVVRRSERDLRDLAAWGSDEMFERAAEHVIARRREVGPDGMLTWLRIEPGTCDPRS